MPLLPKMLFGLAYHMFFPYLCTSNPFFEQEKLNKSWATPQKLNQPLLQQSKNK